MSSDANWLARRGALLQPGIARGAFRRIRLERESSTPDVSLALARPSRVSPNELDRRISDRAALLGAARPHLEWVSTQFAGGGAVVYLVDDDAVVLWSTGTSPSLVEEASASPGSKWSEGSVGINAAGSAVMANEPVFVIGCDQGDPPWRRYTAMAVPLHGPDGKVLGAVVAASPARSDKGDRLTLAAYAAYAAERQIVENDASTPSPDVPVRKRTRQDEGSRFRRLLDSAPDAIVIVDESGAILHASSRCEHVLGYPPQELLGRPVELLISADLRAAHEEYRRLFSANPRAQVMGSALELRATRKDGREIPVEICLSQIRMREGLFVSAAIRDVTSRKKVLRSLEIQFSVGRALAEGFGIGDTIPRVLEAVERGMGWEAGGLWLRDSGGKEVTVVQVSVSPSVAGSDIPPELRASALEAGTGLSRRVWSDSVPVLISNLSEEGSFFKFRPEHGARLHSGYGFPITMESKVIGVLVFFSCGAIQADMETRRMLSSLASQVGQFILRLRTAEDLGASEAKLQLLLGQLPLALWTVDLNLVVTYCAGKLYGQEGLEEANAYLGTSIGNSFSPNHAGSVVHRQAVAGKAGHFDFDRGGKSYACYVEPLRDREGTVVGALGAAIDVTGLKRDQESSRRLNTALERQVGERTEELQAALRENNALSYIIAHNLRGPLRAIASGAQIILEDEEHLREEARHWAVRIAAAANRMDALVLGLLEYSQLARADLVIQTIDLEEIVREVLSQMAGKLSESKASVVVDRPLPAVRGDPLTLIKALCELISNAIKFVSPGVQPFVRIRTERLETELPESRSVRIRVDDNGLGIAPEHRERIFGVFEQLQGRGSYTGTGIGLAITKRIVERMGGKVSVESEVGRGSSFYLDLPGA